MIKPFIRIFSGNCLTSPHQRQFEIYLISPLAKDVMDDIDYDMLNDYDNEKVNCLEIGTN